MPQYLYHNGNYCLANQPLFTAANRSFRYGDSLFESMAMVHDHIPLLHIHCQRLAESASILQMKLPDEVTPNHILDHCRHLCHLNQIAPYARIRLTVYRSDGGLFLPQNNNALLLIEATTLPRNSFALHQSGIHLGLYPQPLIMPSPFSELKTGNALPYIIAAQYRAAHRLDDCLLLNAQQEVAESTKSNLFWVTNQTVCTPPLSSGCLKGIMRRTLLLLLPEIGFTCLEQPCTVANLSNADEIWLTNATTGLQWVKTFDGKTYKNTLAQKIMPLLYALMGF